MTVLRTRDEGCVVAGSSEGSVTVSASYLLEGFVELRLETMYFSKHLRELPYCVRRLRFKQMTLLQQLSKAVEVLRVAHGV